MPRHRQLPRRYWANTQSVSAPLHTHRRANTHTHGSAAAPRCSLAAEAWRWKLGYWFPSVRTDPQTQSSCDNTTPWREKKPWEVVRKRMTKENDLLAVICLLAFEFVTFSFKSEFLQEVGDSWFCCNSAKPQGKMTGGHTAAGTPWALKSADRRRAFHYFSRFTRGYRAEIQSPFTGRRAETTQVKFRLRSVCQNFQ